jgi:hypothetical protein
VLATGSENQKQTYMATLTGETSITVGFHLGSASHNRQAARLALTTILQRKGRVLEAMTEAMAALRQHMDPNDQALLDQLMEVRTQLATLLLRRPGQAVPDQAQVDKLQEEAQALEARISAHSVEFRAQSQPVTLERVQQAIPEGAALVELVVYFPFNPKAPRAEQWGAERYAAYVLHPEGEPGWVDLGEAAPIDQNIEEFRA